MQIFHHSTNTLAKLSIFGGLFILGAAAWVLAEVNRSSYNTGQYIERQQPVQFSHKHHSGDDGMSAVLPNHPFEYSGAVGKRRMPRPRLMIFPRKYGRTAGIWKSCDDWKEDKPIEWRAPDSRLRYSTTAASPKGVGALVPGRVINAAVYQASAPDEWCLAETAHRAFPATKSEVSQS